MALEDIGYKAVVEGLSQFKSSIDQMNQKTQEYVNKTVSGMNKAQKSVDGLAAKLGTTSTRLGATLAAAGAALTASLGLMGRAAIAEEININRLATTMRNAGVEYDNVRESLEGVIAATQRKTGVADNDQRDILNRLILTTGDYAKSLELLPTVLDLAAAGEMDATTAATYLGKAYNELKDGAEEVSVRFGQASLRFKSMEDIQNRVAGSAENLVDIQDVLKAALGDVAEALGTVLLPIIKSVGNIVTDIAVRVKDWAEAHPALTQAIVIATGVMGGMLAVMGGLILALPLLTKMVAAFGVALHVATGPVGLITLAIGALTTAGILLWQNWEKVVPFFQNLWENIKIAFATAVKFIVNTVLMPFIEYYTNMIANVSQGIGKLISFFNEDLGQSIQQFAHTLRDTRQEINHWADDIINNAQINKAAIQARKMGEAISQSVNDALGVTQESPWDYGTWERYYGQLKKAVNDWFGEQQSALEKMRELESEAHSERLDEIRDEYDSAIKAINDELKAKREAYNQEIDAIDRQLEELDDADKQRADAQKKANLEARIATEYDLKKKLELNQELNDLIAASGNKEWQKERQLALEKELAGEQDAEVRAVLQERLNDYLLDIERTRQKAELESEKKNIQDKLKEAEKEAESQREIAQETYDYKTRLENEGYKNFVNDIKNRKELLDDELKETLTRYDEELEAFKEMTAEEVEETRVMVAMINDEISRLRDKTITVTTVHRTVGGSAPLSYEPAPYVPAFAEGGRVSARPGGQIIKAGEAGEDEFIVPASKIGSFISAMMSRPAWATGGINNSRSINYNVNANYSKSQSPASLRYDLEAIAMMARS